MFLPTSSDKERQKTTMSKKIKLREIRDLSQWYKFSESWDRLVKLNHIRHPFLDWTWTSMWLEYIQFHGMKSVLLVVQDDHGEVLGLVPLQVNKIGHLRYVEAFCQNFNDYVDWLCIPELEIQVGHAIRDWLYASRDRYDFIRIYNLLPGGFALKTLAGMDEAELKKHSIAPHIPIQGNYKDYLQTLDRKFLSDTRRRERKLVREHGHVKYFEVDNAQKIPEMMDYIETWFNQRRSEKREKSYFDIPGMKEHLISLYQHLLESYMLHLSGFTQGGRPVAINVAFKNKNRLFSYTPVADPAYRKYALIRLLKLKHIEMCYEKGIEVYDFGLGGEQYKFYFKPQMKQLYAFTLYGKSLMGFMRRIYDMYMKQTFLGRLAKKFIIS